MVEKIRKITKITEDTFLPIGLVLVVIGGVVWLTNLDARGREIQTTLEDRIKRDDDYSKTVQDYIKTVQEISNRLARIEGVLEEMRKSNGR